jgi:Flp pilus assembly protein TadD
MTIPQAFQIAIERYQAGRFDEAQALCQRILQQAPSHAEVMHLLGLIAIHRGQSQLALDLVQKAIALMPTNAAFYVTLAGACRRLKQAEAAVAACRRAIALKPDLAAAHNNLGNALQDQQKLEKATAAFRKAIELDPSFPEAYGNLGSCLLAQEDFDGAADAYARMVQRRPHSAPAHCSLGFALSRMGKFDEGVAACTRALELQPHYVEALNVLGYSLRELGKLDEAAAAFSRSLSLAPNHPETYDGLGTTLTRQGKFDQAAEALRRAIALRPEYGEAHNNLGKLLAEQGRFEEAAAAFRRAIELKPASPEPYGNLGQTLASCGQEDEAIEVYRHAIRLRPGYASAYNDLAVVLQQQGRLHEAIDLYRQAIERSPELDTVHRNLGMTLLQLGDFEQGWPEYEWRLRGKSHHTRYDSIAQRRWDGSDFAGQTLALHTEQGFGDTIQFIRYAPLAGRRGGRVILDCPRELLRLLQAAPGIAEAVTGLPLPQFDLHCALLSLPRLFATRLETIPAQVPYLHVDSDLIGTWAGQLRACNGRLKIGLAWAGHPEHRGDRQRSLKLSQFAPLAKLRDVTFYSLQKGPAAGQAENPPAGMQLVDRTAEIQDFADTAALIANLDLVLTVDTAVAHLAGAMGKPVWILLPLRADWRWLLEREDSPWYPTARLFRQRARGDWAEVIERVARELSERGHSR